MDKIIKVDTRKGDIKTIIASDEEIYWGGRSFISKYLLKNTSPNCEAIGRYNKLILSSGLIADTNVTTTGKLSIGGKSPLTGGIKECNVGGSAGNKLARLGIKALILDDIPEKKQTRILVIKGNDNYLIDAPELKGLWVNDVLKYIRIKYGSDVGIICNGPAGEMMLSGAGIAVTDDKDIQIRYAARGGLGAVMGSKGIKAIIIDDSNPVKSEFADPELLKKASKEIVQYLMKDPKTFQRNTYGTPDILERANKAGLLPTRNFSAGQFEKAENFYGDRIAAIITERGGEGRTGQPCVRGCVIKCSNVFPDKKGRKIVAPIQYENIVLLGSNCGIGDLDEVAEMNNLCNQVGVDAIETGAAIGVAMEAGVIDFGDAEGAKDLIRQIGQGTYLGRIIGSGVVVTGRVLGVRRVPAIKGQASPAYDPRALKGNGVTYITSPMGADHTAGNAFGSMKDINPLKKEHQVRLSRKLQLRAALLDTLGLCIFVRPPFVNNPELYTEIIKGKFGWDWTLGDIRRMSEEVLETEREFNKQAGVSEDYYSIPEFMADEPLPPNNTVFDVPLEEMKNIWDIKLADNEF
jgi:aldehyde:ferredoxin oxidoreductase